MKNLLLFILIFSSLVSYSQIQNEKGKLILNDKDTIVGVITYYDDFSSTVTYSDSTNKTNSCTIDCINEIALDNGLRYRTIDYNDTKLFVKKIITSDLINLYASTENGSVYYYVAKGEQIYRLENNELIVDGDHSRRYVRYDKKYIGIFKIIMSDKSELYPKIDKLKFSKSDFIKIILDYNQGNLTYIIPARITKSKQKPDINAVIFTQYSNYGNYYGGETTDGFSYGLLGGIQFYFSQSKRHSFKLSLGYSHYSVEEEYRGPNGIFYPKNKESEVIGLGIAYEYIFFMTKHTNIYVQVNLGEFSYISEKTENEASETNIAPVPRFSPGIGLEYKTKKRLSFYAEINNLLYFKYIPYNFSAGIRYDIGKKTGNILQK